MNIDVLWNEKFKCFLEGLYLRSSICKNKYPDALMEGDTKNQTLMLDNLLDQVKDDKLYDLNKLDVTLSSIMINAANTTENETKTRPKMKQKQKLCTSKESKKFGVESTKILE